MTATRDPPSRSRALTTTRYTTTSAPTTQAQAQAFTDTWTWDDHANPCYEAILTHKNGVQTQQPIALTGGFEKVLGKGSLLAFLVSMTVQMAETAV